MQVIGRTTGLGLNILHLAAYPIHLVRKLTDPIFDFVIARASSSVAALATKVAPAKEDLPTGTKLIDLGNWFSEWSRSLAERASTLASDTAVVQRSSPTTIFSDLQAKAASFAQSTGKALGFRADSMLSEIEALPAVAITTVARLYKRLYTKTQGDSLSDRLFCVGVGWAHWGGILTVQSYVDSALFSRFNVKWLKTSLEQQLLLLKVILFTIIEVVCFPFGCGLLLDLCTIPLWEDTTMATRWLHFSRAPFSTGFTVWVAGTLWM